MKGKSAFILTIAIILIMNCLIHAGPLLAQSFQTGYTIVSFKENDRGTKRVRAIVYYPSLKAGKEQPLAGTPGEKFPVVSFGHGYQLPATNYENIRKALVPEGFIVAFPLTERGMFPSHSTLGKDIAFVASQLRKEGETPNSLFYGKVGEKCGYMGHSMGGGSAVLGAANGPVPDAMILLAPLETRPSAVEAAAKVTIPTLIFAGENDCITPPGSNQDPIYEALGSPDKTYITILGGSHCQMAGDHVLCRLAEATCSPKPAVSREEQHAVIDRYLVPWLKSRLKGEKSEDEKMVKLLKNDPSVTWTMVRGN